MTTLTSVSLAAAIEYKDALDIALTPPEEAVQRTDTLTLYVGHPAIDLKQLEIPDSVKVSCDLSESSRAEKKDDPVLKAIDKFIAQRGDKSKALKR